MALQTLAFRAYLWHEICTGMKAARLISDQHGSAASANFTPEQRSCQARGARPHLPHRQQKTCMCCAVSQCVVQGPGQSMDRKDPVRQLLVSLSPGRRIALLADDGRTMTR